MNKNNTIALLSILLLASLLGLAITYLKLTQLPFSMDVLSLTEPAHALEATVDSFDGKTLRITTAKLDKKLSYTVKITDKTTFSRLQDDVSVFSFLMPAKFDENLPTAKELTSGMTVNVQSNQDLRTVKDNVINALIITFKPASHVLKGGVMNTQGNRIILNTGGANIKPGNLDNPNPDMGEKVYEVAVTNTTEFYQSEKIGLPPQKVAAKQVNTRDLIAIYTNEDIDGGKPLTATYILLPPKILPTRVNDTP